VNSLPSEEQVALLKEAAAAAGDTLRQCLRCGTAMMRGDLIYRDLGGGETTQVREVKWGIARRELRFLGLVSEWVIQRALPLDAWRCKACGYCELATAPDPQVARDAGSSEDETEDSTTLL
jgi:hypothetical protein